METVKLMEGRCGVLCQHPGCWYTGEKKYLKSRNHGAYMQYLDHLIAKKNLKGVRNYPSQSIHAFSRNGLPVLTVSDLANNAFLSPSLSSQRALPHLLQLEQQLADRNQTLALPVAACTTLRTEKLKPLCLASEALGSHTSSTISVARVTASPPPPAEYSEYLFTPVLVWRPGQQKERGKKPDTEKKEDKLLKTLDLTDSLPLNTTPQRQPVEKKCRIHSARCCSKGFGLNLDQYIMEGLGDVPPHIVHQIIQELRSQSDTDVVPVQSPCLLHPLDGQPQDTFPSVPVPSPLPPLDETRPLIKTPSSKILDLYSKKIYNSNSKEKLKSSKKARRKQGNLSYSRVLASRPEEALSGLKVKITKLKQEADQYHLMGRSRELNEGEGLYQNPKPSFREGLGSRFPGMDLLKPSAAISSGPSTYFAPRSLTKATLQRLNYHVNANTKTTLLPESLAAGRLDLSITSAKTKWKQSVPEPLLNPPRLSIHIPVLPIEDRPFSEEVVSTETPSHYPEPYTRSGSGLHSGTALSHMSSDHMIISADQTGDLLLLNRAGEVVHQVKETDTDDASLPMEPVSGDEAEEKGRGQSSLEKGSVAPPPTARSKDEDDNNEKQEQKNMIMEEGVVGIP